MMDHIQNKKGHVEGVGNGMKVIGRGKLIH